MNDKGTELEVITKEQTQTIEVAKAYADGLQNSANHYKGYGFLFGMALNQLKEITPHGQFEALAAAQFPDFSDRWLRELMTFAKAITFKTELSSVLKNGQLLLALPDNEKEKLFTAVEEKTGDKGIREIVLDWKKKQQKAKEKAAPAPTPADDAKRRAGSADLWAAQLIRDMAVGVKTKFHALLTDERAEELEDARLTFGNALAELRKHRKASKSKA